MIRAIALFFGSLGAAYAVILLAYGLSVVLEALVI